MYLRYCCQRYPPFFQWSSHQLPRWQTYLEGLYSHHCATSLGGLSERSWSRRSCHFFSLSLLRNYPSAYLGFPSLPSQVCLSRSQGKLLYDGNRALPARRGDSRFANHVSIGTQTLEHSSHASVEYIVVYKRVVHVQYASSETPPGMHLYSAPKLRGRYLSSKVNTVSYDGSAFQ